MTLRQHLSKLGSKGGSSRSKAKTLASRLNGALGGRPRKAKPVVHPDSTKPHA